MSFAAASVIAGHYDVVIAGGVESMTRVPMGTSVAGKWQFGEGYRERYGIAPNQGLGAEMIVDRWGFTRTQLDEFSLGSHAKAAAAQDEGRFSDEIAPVTSPAGTKVDADEGVRRGGTVEGLAALKPAFRPENGTITAANSSQISDGAAALLMTTGEKAAELGLTPIVRIHTAVVTGDDDPVIMLSGPIPATATALARSGLSVGDIGAFEVNEAFAPVPLAWLAETGPTRPGSTPTAACEAWWSTRRRVERGEQGSAGRAATAASGRAAAGRAARAACPARMPRARNVIASTKSRRNSLRTRLNSAAPRFPPTLAGPGRWSRGRSVRWPVRRAVRRAAGAL